MLQSLKDTVREPYGTEAAIRQALMSPAGLQAVWVIVEAEDDVAVYGKFMQPDSTIVKTSESATGRKGYANVELIVRAIKEEEPRAHIFGIRDADYTRFEKRHVAPENIFLTDRRDLEMMMLASPSVQIALRAWAPVYDAAFTKCIPICRHFGYLRLYNSLNSLSVIFHDNLRTGMYWDYQNHDLKANWEHDSTEKFISLTNGECSVEKYNVFVTTHSLAREDFFDICRGHDLIPILSKALVREHIYSEGNIMLRMAEAFSLDDFMATRLYTSIQTWQDAEHVVALVA